MQILPTKTATLAQTDQSVLTQITFFGTISKNQFELTRILKLKSLISQKRLKGLYYLNYFTKLTNKYKIVETIQMYPLFRTNQDNENILN